MAKQITQGQIDQLKKLRASLNPATSIDNKIGTVTHIKQILKDIDLVSSFSSGVSSELISLNIERADYKKFATLTSIIDNAINYYESL
jgi:hypothetical protein